MEKKTNDLDVRRKRAIYRAGHRGTKELDILLSRFATARINDMSEAELVDFEALLEFPDPQLQAWLVSIDPPSQPGVPATINVVRAFHGLN